MMRQDGLEFLSSSLKRRLTGKPVVAWRNIGCFLMLPFQQFFFCMELPYVPVCYGLKIQILLKSLALSQEIELRAFKLKKNYRP